MERSHLKLDCKTRKGCQLWPSRFFPKESWETLVTGQNVARMVNSQTRLCELDGESLNPGAGKIFSPLKYPLAIIQLVEVTQLLGCLTCFE